MLQRTTNAFAHAGIRGKPAGARAAFFQDTLTAELRPSPFLAEIAASQQGDRTCYTKARMAAISEVLGGETFSSHMSEVGSQGR